MDCQSTPYLLRRMPFWGLTLSYPLKPWAKSQTHARTLERPHMEQPLVISLQKGTHPLLLMVSSKVCTILDAHPFFRALALGGRA